MTENLYITCQLISIVQWLPACSYGGHKDTVVSDFVLQIAQLNVVQHPNLEN